MLYDKNQIAASIAALVFGPALIVMSVLWLADIATPMPGASKVLPLISILIGGFVSYLGFDGYRTQRGYQNLDVPSLDGSRAIADILHKPKS